MPKQCLRDVLVAIKSVKARAKTAMVEGDTLQAKKLMGDLWALEVCLVIETDKYLSELDDVA